MDTIKVKVMKIKQSIGEFYVAKIRGSDLYQMAKADIMTIAKVSECELTQEPLYEGNQRQIIEEKVESIENYLTAYDATFPNSIILNVNKTNIINISDDEIELYKKEDTFTIIDGQHRLEGFRDNNYNGFELVVSIFINLSKQEQSRIFATINTEQTKVDSSQGLYLEMNENLYTPRKVVAQIASMFHTDNQSPWHGRIKLIGRKDGLSSDGIISLSAFATPIINYIYDDKDFYKLRNELTKVIVDNENSNEEIIHILKGFEYSKKYILWNLYSTRNDKAIYKILFNYFSSFKVTFKKDWGNTKGLLMKTTGYNAMMYLFKDLYEIGYRQKDFSQEFFNSYIEQLKPLDGKINTFNYGASGLKSSKELYNDFREHLKLL